MSKELVSIMLAFENCDDFTVYKNEIGDFYLGEFEKSYSRIACNSISDIESANKFYIEIHKDANTNENRNINFIDSGLPFDRVLAYNDIAQLVLNFEDNTSEVFYPNWEGEDEYNNEAQTSIVSKVNGSLFIVIHKTETVKEIFKDKIEDDDDFHWTMYRD
ncbi:MULTISPECIES: hypothetical protein [Lysinibacillus]|uniref:hypothetical protein n=1 Tax=Lysinibacillus TaxID=400634 RepID=UPI00214AC684|nr:MULTISPECIES: hypothetical protein [Lysinibacillus]UUV25939.1 hypothetical protein NP781_04785 [Lysinibacillus sp. FN11]UYB48812.1 hypothetical protein OCI51_07575 [Lysinibacillus capsici]